MAATQGSGGGRFLTFWTTLPGFLTAAAAVITAIAGLYVATRDPGDDEQVNTATASPSVTSPAQSGVERPDGREEAQDREPAATAAPLGDENLDPFGGRGPSTPADVPANELNLGALDADVSSAVQSVIDDCAAGDEAACGQLLDGLVQECTAGFGLSCDVLFQITDAGSELEAFGATCGGRFPDFDLAGSCAEL
jgi:hypothetical protein